MNKFHPLISVIVPVHNVERQLERCIKSILAQTYSNFELILINDGSQDKSGYICDFYVHIDSRVKAYHKDNGGASSARNLGIQHAKGDYIVFVDSDDFVDKEYLSAFLVDSLNIDKYTYVIQSLKIFQEGGGLVKKPTFKEGLYSNDNFSDLFTLNNLSKNGYTVCKLYNREIINKNNIRFNAEIRYREDLIFMMTYLLHITNVFISSESNYNYMFSEGSLSKSYNSYESEILTFNLLKRTFNILVDKFHLNNQAKENYYKNTLGTQLKRSMLTIYRPKNKKSKRERLFILKELNTKENSYYLGCTISGLKINRIGFLLYRQECISLFDLYYSTVYFFRYKLNKLWQKYLKRKN